MITFYDRPTKEKVILKKAYDFEIEAIENNSTERNPYMAIIKAWSDGKEMIEALNMVIELAYN